MHPDSVLSDLGPNCLTLMETCIPGKMFSFFFVYFDSSILDPDQT